MAKECENCSNKSDFKAPACRTCMVSYYDGEQLGLPSNFKPKPKTNADRIRAMSDEELAKLLYDPDGLSDIYCQDLPECGELLDTEDGIPEEKCIACALRWLRQPAKEA